MFHYNPIHKGFLSPISGGFNGSPITVSGINLVFSALTYDPTTYAMTGVLTGTGDITVARTTTQYVLDHESIYRSAAANKPAYFGGRKVENFLLWTEDLTDSIWSKVGGVTISTTDEVDPNGGSTAFSLSAPATDWYFYDNISPAGTCVFSVWVKRNTGTDQPFRLFLGTTNSAVLTATSVWQRFSLSVTGLSALSNSGLRTSSGATAAELLIWHPQLENSTGRTDTTTPSEYVATTTAAATKWYSNANGNTVASNVVTEAAGSLLSPLPMLQVDPVLTNSMTYSRDLTNAAWTATTMTTAYTSVGLTGAANTATRLTATGANSTVIRAAVHTAASATHATKWYIKRITGTGAIELTLDNGSTWQDVTASVGATYGEGIPVQQVTLTNPQVGIRLVTSGDAVDIGNAELFATKTIADIRGAGFIPTTTAAVTTGAQTGTFDSANISDTSGLITFTFATQGTQNLISTFAEEVGTDLQLDDGTTQDTVAAAVDTTHKAGIWWHGSEMGLCINGVCEAAVAYDGTILDGALDLFRSGGFVGQIGPIKIYRSGNATSYQTQAVTDTTP